MAVHDYALGNITLYALFDYDATRSFVLTTFTRMYNLSIESLPQIIVAAIPDGSIVMCRIFPPSLDGRIVKTNLIVFNLLRFNLILGMNWLTQNYAEIDC